MSKGAKIAIAIGAIAAVISAIVVVVVFWDKLLEKFSCCGLGKAEDDYLIYDEEDETADFADLPQE